MRRIPLVMILAIALVALYGTYCYSKSRSHQLFGTIVERVETEKKVVALTFDDGPTTYAVDEILAYVLTHARPGSVILLHPWYHGREPTREAIAPIIAGLRARGYDFVTVSELLSIGREVSGSRGLAGSNPETARPRDSATP